MSNHNVKNYAAHGGNEWVVGGKLTILDSATVTGITATSAAASTEALGGVKAAAKGEQDTVEAKIGTDSKLYVPGYPAAYVLPAAAPDVLGGVKLAANVAAVAAEGELADVIIALNAALVALKASGAMAADT